jgi:uncharacterized membrane protein YoaK (UPF0700 family)
VTRPEHHATGQLATRTTFLLVLTFAAGAADAASIAGIDGVFVANQTGNVILAPLGIAGWPAGADLDAAITSIVCFVAGALLASRLLPRALERGWEIPVARATAVHLALVLGVVALWATGTDGAFGRLLATALLAGALGIQAATARRMAVPGLPTVVLTGALVGLSVESPEELSARRRWIHELASLVVMAAGAAAAAAALHVSLGLALGVGAAAVAAAVVIALDAARRA